MRIADELLLLAIHPAGGRPVIGRGPLDLALAGALLADLALAGRIHLDGDRVEPARAAPVPAPAAARDPELDGALARIVQSPGRHAHRVVADLSGSSLRLALRNGLIGQGILAEEEQRILGVLRSLSHPELNPAPRCAILGRLDAALAASAAGPLGQRTAALLGIAHACGLAHVLFSPVPDLDRRVADRTAGGWAGPVVAKAIARMQADADAAVAATGC